MDRRALAAVAVGAFALALGLAWLSAPDVGPPATPPPPRLAAAPAPEEPVPVPVRPPPFREPQRTPAPAVDTGEPKVIPPVAPDRPERIPPIDPNRVYEPDLHGMAEAALSRRAELGECWAEHVDRTGNPEGRFTIRVTVSDGEGGQGKVDTEVANVPVEFDPDLAGCVQEVMADARFDSPGPEAQSLIWPVPLPPR